MKLIDLLGWNNLTEEQLEWFKESRRSIVLFPHTSRWDTFTILLYVMSYPELSRSKKIWTVIRQSKINDLCNELFYSKYFNMLTTPSKRGSSGFVERTVTRLKDEDEFMLLLSPEGGCERSEWKSGYYALAKELKANVSVIGFDYVDHRMKIVLDMSPDWNSGTKIRINPVPDSDLSSSVIATDTLQTKIEDIAKESMSLINPLVPEYSFVSRKGSDTPTCMSTQAKVIWTIIFILFLVVVIRVLRKLSK